MGKIKPLDDADSSLSDQNKTAVSERSDSKKSKQDKETKDSSSLGWTLYYLMPLLIVLLGILLTYFSAFSKLDAKSRVSSHEKSKAAPPAKKPAVLLTAAQLAKHDGSDPNLPIYLVILGKVYNVDKGKNFYAPGTGYNVFAGRDSTPSFITGKFSREEATDDVSGLSPEDMLGVKDWMDFYRKDYTYVGKVIGRYYDNEGNPTEALKAAREKIKEGRKLKKAQEAFSQKFPGCNSKWNQDEGSTVWCSQDSAGIHRDWVGVPRQLFKPGKKDPTCVCVRTSGPAVDTREGDSGDLNNPNLREYKGCGKMDVSCKMQN